MIVPREPPLLQELQRALPTLSPKLGRVARFCIQHAATLHHYRIQDIADACGTMPASVVRLAQRFGLKGFQEMKLAFIDRVETATPRDTDRQEPQPPECMAAQQDLEVSTLGLHCLHEMVAQPEFVQLVQSLRCAPLVRFDWSSEEDRLIALYLQSRLRAAGCRQVDGGSQNLGSLAGRSWLVQIAVWRGMAGSPGLCVASDFGDRVLRLTQGSVNHPATIGRDGVVVRVGTDSRRMLNAFALCEALATALKESPRSGRHHRATDPHPPPHQGEPA
jgi:hypothetical protein